MSEREIPLMREFLAGYRHPRVKLFRRNIIDKTVADIHTLRKFQVKAGIKGQCDIYGHVKMNIETFRFLPSIPIEIELKGARTVLSDEQKNWRKFCEDWGIPYLLLQAQRDEAAPVTLMRWAQELNALVSHLTQ